MFEAPIVDFFSTKNTPFFFYDFDILRNILKEVKSIKNQYGYKVHFALKANSNPEILKIISEAGFGADCVSGNEVLRAIETGFDPENIVFAGVGKTDDEINISLNNNISCLNVESLQELEVINNLAAKKKKLAKIALRINPGIDARTHKYTTTGTEENKFGIYKWDLKKTVDLLKNLNNLVLKGLHFHIGSQITDMNVFIRLCDEIIKIIEWFSNCNIKIENINVGGGLAVNYHDNSDELPDFKNYFEIFNKNLNIEEYQKLHFELGRSIVANCGSLISKVLYIKKGKMTNFAILDAGITELIRPALYQALHQIENISSNSKQTEKYDVVGPICESSDFFAKGISLPETKRGDIIVIKAAGAYGQVMSSDYNLRTKAKAIYSDEIN